MPELPEVETIRRELEPLLTGRMLGEAWSFPHPKFDPALDAAGATITRLDRRGKYLLIALHDDRELVVHLGMTGSLQIRPLPDVQADPYVRAWWVLDDAEPDPATGREVGPTTPTAAEPPGARPAAARRAATGTVVLAYRDVRRFGRLAVVPRGKYLGTLAVQGPDALDPALAAEDLWQALRSSRRAVKTQLLSQRPLAGVGNIYADEALWLAGIHPRRRGLSRPQAARLLDALREVMTASLEHRGTTFRDYRTASGEPGSNQDRLACYGRAGLPCLRCGTTLRRTVLDGRSTTWCPTCQPR